MFHVNTIVVAAMWVRILGLQRPMAAAFLTNHGPTIMISRSITTGASTRNHYPLRSAVQQPLVPTISIRYPVSRLFSYRPNDRTANNNDNDYHDDVDDDDEDDDKPSLPHYPFKPGEKVLVEVTSFGPLGASVHVLVAGSHSPTRLPPEEDEWPVLGTGLINQKELAYFRDSRDHLEVVLGEVLPAYVERVRDVDGKLAIALRAFGGRAKARDVGQQILDLLEASPDGRLELGDKSSPEDVAAAFPGVSKASFKKAVSALYKNGQIDKPLDGEIRLLKAKK